MAKRLEDLGRTFRHEGIFTSTPRIENESFREGVRLILPITNGLFGPNSLFLKLPRDFDRDEDLKYIIDRARYFSLGVHLFLDTEENLRRGRSVNV